ncbi:protein of unknown function (plasmid) [Pararobbsia alpina]
MCVSDRAEWNSSIQLKHATPGLDRCLEAFSNTDCRIETVIVIPRAGRSHVFTTIDQQSDFQTMINMRVRHPNFSKKVPIL